MNQLKQFFFGSILLIVPLAVIDAVLYFFDIRAGILVAIGIVFYLIVSYFYFRGKGAKLSGELMDFAFEQGQIQSHLLDIYPVPYALINGEGNLVWNNRAFEKITGGVKAVQLRSLFPELNRKLLPSEMNHTVTHIRHRQKDGEKEKKHFYKVEFYRISMANDSGDRNDEFSMRLLKEQSLIAVYFFDQTMLKKYMEQNESQRMAVGLIYIDNYDEVLDGVDDVRQSMLLALADRRISKYVLDMSGIVKKTDKDKYLVIFKQKYLQKMEETKFPLLDDIKSINIGNTMEMTLSISIGVNGRNYQEVYEYACSGMDLALGRGGDQAVVKDGDDITYYGGNSEVVEKNTRVKARVKAHALKELLESKDKVVIMSHKIPDPDAMGSAVGLYRLGVSLGRKAHIVMNEMTISVRPVVQALTESGVYEQDMFINNGEAADITDENTLLIIVDVNHENYVECSDLLEKTNTIVILDHHRKNRDTIKNPVLSYIEPYASSTCELVAEILQYIDSKPKLLPAEANAMYAGMMIDTDNFSRKTGVRTFEAAAYLKRNGADIAKVRKMSRTSMSTYRIRSKAVSEASILFGEFAVTTLEGVGMDSPTVVGAQVANELLDIIGVKASFVLTGVEERVYVSARSIDEVNVQKIMEDFGGGGHLTVAGAQLVDVSLSEAREIIEAKIKQMKEKGDI